MSEETTKISLSDLEGNTEEKTNETNLESNEDLKVNLNETKDELQQEQEVPASNEENESEEAEEELQLQDVDKESEEQVLELIEEDVKEDTPSEEAIEETKEQVTENDVIAEAANDPKIELPENIQKVVDFMNETGGTLEDYVTLNKDLSTLDEQSLLKDYYKKTKSHLDNEEIDFLIEDNFSFDEDMDEERDIRRKKLAYKEEVAKAKQFLEDQKSKYYEEIKLNSKLAPEQQKAVEFFNRYNQEQSEIQKVQEQQITHFQKETEKVFGEDFKGFDFKVGNNKYRFKVNDVEKTKEVQSDINNVISKFLDDKNLIADAAGYHKALFAANNADSLANHFYEQGRADAIKQISNESKNVNMDVRKTSTGVVEANGLKVRAITGDDSSGLKIKLRK